MSSSFYDENDNALVPSTPKKRLGTGFTCSHCGKKYVVKHYFEKHQATHLPKSTNNQDRPLDVSVASTNVASEALHDSDLNFIALEDSNVTLTSTPFTFKVPVQPPKRVKNPKPRFVCTYCLKEYMSEKHFKAHCMNHTVQHAASRYPDKTQIIPKAASICSDALVEVSKSPSAGESGTVFCDMIKYLESIINTNDWVVFSEAVCGELLDCVIGTKFLLPSLLLGKLVDQVEKVLNDVTQTQCGKFLEMLHLPKRFNSDLLCVFFLEFILSVAKVILFFISNAVRAQNPRPNRTVPELDGEEKEVIYYIGGSIIRGYLRLAFRYKKNSKWSKIADVLKCKVISDDLDKHNDAKWTVAINRGGLIFISDLFQQFLVALSTVVFENEKADGSISYGDVIKCVSSSSICLLWDDMIGDALSETVSLNLMNDVIEYYCKTCGRGFAKTRLNKMREKPVVSMSTRHLAASRKRK